MPSNSPHQPTTSEINCATPKTQSVLLEAIEERTVTSGSTTHELEAPFRVMAIQKPIETAGAYPVLEAQLAKVAATAAVK